MNSPTFTTGIYHDIPAEEYHAANGVSNSQLKHLNPPARFPVAMATKTEPTPFMRMGTLVHAAILEPDKPFPAITVQPETYPAPATHADVKAGKIAAGEPLKWSNNAKWCKGWYAAQKQAGQDVMSAQEFGVLNGCVKALTDDPWASRSLSVGEGEVSVFAPLTLPSGREVLRRMRLDWVRPPVIYDIKVVQEGNGSREAFEKLAFERRYHVQAAYYMDGWNNVVCTSDQVEAFVFFVVERKEPFLVSRFEVAFDSEVANAGRAQYIQDLETFMDCNESGVWPGYPPGFQPLGLPGWARRKLNQ